MNARTTEDKLKDSRKQKRRGNRIKTRTDRKTRKDEENKGERKEGKERA